TPPSPPHIYSLSLHDALPISVHYFGKNGNAAAMKLVGNLIVALEMEALAEGLILAQKAGLDLKTVMEVVKVADFRSPLLVNNGRSEEHTSELQSRGHLVCRLL